MKTRCRIWVGLIACAWLIQRFTLSSARLLWIEPLIECVPNALGLDFDSATFTHVDGRVSFEVLPRQLWTGKKTTQTRHLYNPPPAHPD
ncbi:chromate resistance protein ChrB domain-containing protein [Alcaligenes sp. SDU_A2]|uniref:chromate resistance protein ChrB domain-containing protein n=1 Tax=Alcaligenes sp. SDU_A2 TaxID=3136634 RepID=UPI00404A6C7B